ncbi:MAG: PQQ-binding-like beta-propeller repeat protein [Fuerstiella sp.]
MSWIANLPFYAANFWSAGSRVHDSAAKVQNPFGLPALLFGRMTRFLMLASVLVGMSSVSPVVAQDVLIEEDPDRRKILRILGDLQDITPENFSRLADAFDAGWALAVRSEDPLLNLTTDREQSLKPGTSELDAAARYRLQQVFMNSPEAFRQIYRDQVKSAAEAAFNQAMQSADLRQLEAVVQRFQFTDVAIKGLQHLIQLRRSRGEYLQAALQHGRWMSLNSDVDLRHRVLQIQLWYQAGLPEEGLDDLSDLLDGLKGEETKLLQQVSEVFSIKVDLPSAPFTRESLDAWIGSGFVSLAAGQPKGDPSIKIEVGGTAADSVQPLGNARRNQISNALLAGQLESVWRQSTFSCLEAVELNAGLELIAAGIGKAIPAALELNETVLPIASPIVVGNRLIVRCAMNLRALDLKTGEPLWESFLLDRHLRSSLELQAAGNDRGLGSVGVRESFERSMLNSHWIQANTGGQLTSDGRTVFAVEDVMSETLRNDASRQLEESRVPANYLRAYDVETGSLRAQAGGTVGINSESGAVNPLAGMYFLGAPLVLGDRIYVIAEAEPGIYLLQLKATPLFGPIDEFELQPVLGQLLSVPRFPLRMHPVRNQAGIVPSYGRGLIICSTCDEHIIAISAEDHSVRWIYRYSTIVAPAELGPAQGVISGARGFNNSMRFDRRSRWTDCLPRIVNNRIIVTPRDSDQLLCLDLQTGEQLWTMPRGRYRTVATVDQQQVVVTGANVVSAFRLSDGTELWSTKIQHGQVCGTGYSDGEVLQLPTSRPGILALRLADGQQLVDQVTGKLPGNLLSDGDSLISQDVVGIQRFVAAKSGPEGMLAARKKLIQGEFVNGANLLRQCVQDAETSKQRRMAQSQFVDAVLGALRVNDRAGEGFISEAQTMLIELRSRDEVLALLLGQAMGIPPVSPAFLRFQDLEYADQQWAELEDLVNRNSLVNLDEQPSVVAERMLALLKRTWVERQEVIRDTFSIVRKERRVMQMIRTAINQAEPRRRVELQGALGQALKDQLAVQESSEKIQWWLNACLLTGITSPAAEFVMEQSDQLTGIPDAFSDLIVRHHVDREGSNAAAEMLIELMQKNNQGAALKDLLTTTKQHREWQDVRFDQQDGVLASGHFSNELLSDADLDLRLAELTQQPLQQPWRGVPAVVESDAYSATGSQGMNRMGSVAEDLPVFDSNNQYRHWNFLVESTSELGPLSPVMNAYDSEGQLRWSHSLGREQRRTRFYGQHPTLQRYVVGMGQLVLLRRSNEVTMLDCSKANVDVAPRVLWKKTLLPASSQPVYFSSGASSWERTTVYDRQPTGLAPAGPISEFGLPIVVGAELFVVDPFSGIEQWQVSGISEDCGLTVRDDRLYVLSQSSSQIEIRSMLDGALIETRSIPDWWRDAEENSTTTPRYFELDRNDEVPFRIQISDGNCVLYRYGLKKVTVESYNLDDSKVNWLREFPGESSVSNVCGGVIAVLLNGNQLQLVDTTTGAVKEAVDVSISTPENFYLYLRRSGDRWLVITDQFNQEHGEQNPVSQSVIVSGAVHGLSLQDGKLVWSYPIENEHLRIRRPGSGQPAIPSVAPFLTLLKRPSPEVNRLGIRVGRTLYQAKILDVGTGQVVYRDLDVGFTLSNFYMKLKPSENQILLNFDKRSVTFDYSRDQASKTPSQEKTDEP